MVIIGISCVLLVKFFLALKVIFFKINERATLPEMEKEKKNKERGRRQRKKKETGKGKRKKQENKKQTYVA